MMKPIRPNISKGATYPSEFREDAVRYWLSSGHTLTAVASDLGLSPQCLRDWRQQMELTVPQGVAAHANDLANTSDELALAREIGQLRRELEAMTRQRDILKRLFPSSRTTKA